MPDYLLCLFTCVRVLFILATGSENLVHPLTVVISFKLIYSYEILFTTTIYSLPQGRLTQLNRVLFGV